jgi:hypothetical protein
VLVWQASAPEMNPTLAVDYLERMADDDPESYRAEVLGEFRAGVATFLDPEAIAACVAEGVRELAPVASTRYFGFVDPSGGRHDRFTLAISHVEKDRAILDVLRMWKPPFNPSGVIAEAAVVLKPYRIGSVDGDRYSAEFVVEQFRGHGITYTAAERDRSSLYLELLPLINAGQARLLDHPELLRELRGLERRRGTSGRDRVDHRPGQYDDLANSAAGALVTAAESARVTTRLFFPDAREPVEQKVTGPEQRQLLSAYGPAMFQRPSGEFTCGTCASFDAEQARCTARQIGTRGEMLACKVYDPRLMKTPA